MRNSFGERYAERQKNGVAWHAGPHTKRLEGQGANASSALEVAELNYPIVVVPSEYTFGGKQYASKRDFLIVRGPVDNETEPYVIGRCGGDFTPLQNAELARLLDPLTEKYGWEVETIGALGQGQDMFVTLDAGTTIIGGDDVRQFFFVWNSNDGTNKVRVRVTPVRVVCWNTCIMGDEQATTKVDVRHDRNVLAQTEFAIDLVARLRHAQQTTLAGLNKLTTFTLGADQVRDFVEALYPTSEQPESFEKLNKEGLLSEDEKLALMRVKSQWETRRIAALENRMLAYQCWERLNDEIGDRNMARSGWVAYNMVTEVENWKEGGSDKEWVKSVMQGDRARIMAQAFNSLTAMVVKQA